MKDPNPDVSGGGCEFLRNNGLEVTVGVLEPECRRLNEGYLKFVSHKRPFVMVKSALTLDGWTATSTGDSRWVTSEKSRRFVHGLRNQADAIMVGVGTVLADTSSKKTWQGSAAGCR
jgi:diaminohydroxyphosphoribosylaminopyrimidine deaminase/5-amino-6-(5-phosphoribosylamino)uracil reductase